MAIIFTIIEFRMIEQGRFRIRASDNSKFFLIYQTSESKISWKYGVLFLKVILFEQREHSDLKNKINMISFTSEIELND